MPDDMVRLLSQTNYGNFTVFFFLFSIQLAELRAHYRTISDAPDKSHIPIQQFLRGSGDALDRNYKALVGMWRLLEFLC